MITTTVGEVIDALTKYDRNTPIVKGDPNKTGYTRIILTRAMAYRIEVSFDDLYEVDFIDTLSPNNPNSFLAIVL